MKQTLFIVFNILTFVARTGTVSPFTGKEINPNENTYSFFVSGHFHGSSTNVSGFPASTLLAGIDMVNRSGVSFVLSTGDLFLDVRNDIPNYKRALFQKMQVPLFNAPGNHDISGDVYEQNYGKTWSSFTIGSELFILLNTEKNDGNIEGEQLEFFQRTLEQNCKEKNNIVNIFICSHRPIWSEKDETLKFVFQENTKSDFGNNFEETIKPLLKKYSRLKHIYWFSGSLGGNAPASFFYYVDENKITFIQSAIRDLPRDGFLQVMVNNGAVSFKTISLTEQKMPRLEDCGLDMWKNAPGQPFNYRLVPLYIKQMLLHRYFWYGIIYALAGILIFVLLRRRIKRKKIAQA